MPSTLTLVGSPTIGSIDNAADWFWIWDTSASSLNKVTVSTVFNNFSLVYANGVSGGQSLSGGTAANDDLTLQGTTNATRTTSYVLLQPNGGNVGIGEPAPAANLHISNATTSTLRMEGGNTTAQIDAFSTGNNVISRIETARDGANTSGKLIFSTATVGTLTERLTILANGNVGIGELAPAAMLQVEQTSSTGAKPALRLQQADVSEEFIRFDTTVGTGNPINTTALGAYYGRVRVFVEGIGAKWLALYD
jgi:hypothetical protein